MSRAIKIVGAAHDRVVHDRRIHALADAIAPLLDPGWTLLDVGCGDGRLARLVAERVPRLAARGYEVLVREDTAIDVSPFDGRHIPETDDAVDAVMLVDVLHHTDDPPALLHEAARVARRAVILKDHRTSRPLARATLRFMDWVGNRAHGVALPYNYLSSARWDEAFRDAGLSIERYETRLGLYPWPANVLFESGLHFVARLDPGGDSSASRLAAKEGATGS